MITFHCLQNAWTQTKTFQKGYRKFCAKYMLLQEEHKIAHLKLEDAIKKMRERPYQQYSQEEGSWQEPLKNTRQLRKQKLRKYIKKIKIATLQDDDDNKGDMSSIQTKTTPLCLG